jgi:hypothetical protein
MLSNITIIAGTNFMRRTAEYTSFNQKGNEDILRKFKTKSILDSILKYKTNLIQTLLKLIKMYEPHCSNERGKTFMTTERLRMARVNKWLYSLTARWGWNVANQHACSTRGYEHVNTYTHCARLTQLCLSVILLSYLMSPVHQSDCAGLSIVCSIQLVYLASFIIIITPWSESASELYRPSDRRFSAKWLPTFAD